ncbi:hypothetical protein E3U55_06490 [Filobacillus milosensis]|uniref:Uncharacterized protein n=1 Tax=Filobacillus milosensis TaxID=94137 RepID=A0A4Y8IQA8_9BACI|nr:hypothetical protein [Filobacillus milosensis]TFB22883.1 hypothetical protein E3U55_06490 [Filobacillus milosensis]
MKYLIVLLVSLGLLMGCQDDAVEEPAAPEPVEEETEEDVTEEKNQETTEKPEEEVKFEEEPEEEQKPSESDSNEQDIDEGTDNVGSGEGDQVSKEAETFLSVDEAREIVENNLATSIGIMQQLQSQKQNWFGMVEGTQEYNEAVEVTKTHLSDTISSHVINEWAEHYLKEFFIYNHFILVLQPYSLNTRFNLEMSNNYQFTLSFVQLGDEAFNETMQFNIHYYNEAGNWKFAGYDAEEISEPLNLTFEDLEEAFIDGEKNERYAGTLVEKMEHEGESYLIIDYKYTRKAINVNTGYDESYILQKRSG